MVASYNPERSLNRPSYQREERSDGEEAAYQRWRNAVRAIGITDSDVVISVCCHDYAPEVRKIAGLRRGLERLVKWYGMDKTSKN
jgi:hypothetical protein